MNLSLDIPNQVRKNLAFSLIRLDQSIETFIQVIDSNTTFHQLCDKLSRLLNQNVSCIHFDDCTTTKISENIKILENEPELHNIYFYELEKGQKYTLVANYYTSEALDVIPLVFSMDHEQDEDGIEEQFKLYMNQYLLVSENNLDLDFKCKEEEVERDDFFHYRYTVFWGLEEARRLQQVFKHRKSQAIMNKELSDDLDTTETTLVDCIKDHLKQETIDEWYCRNCKEMVTGKKKLDLYKLPDILMIQLKRFFQYNNRWMKKDAPVTYDLNGIDLSEFELLKQDSCIYNVVGVTYHIGRMSGGHYVASCNVDGDWIYFDDDVDTFCPEDKHQNINVSFSTNIGSKGYVYLVSSKTEIV